MSNESLSSKNNKNNNNNNNNNNGVTAENNSLFGLHAERMKQSIGGSLAALTTSFTTKRYTLPDKNVASQVLMYRQLLHTECKPGLRLSRAYQATSAQKAVKHMPWWEQGVETTKKMVISYDNLIVRLWLNGAIMPFTDGGYASDHKHIDTPKDSSSTTAVNNHPNNPVAATPPDSTRVDSSTNDDDAEEEEEKEHVDTLINEKGLPPIPHDFWVDRLGFQQTDPVTDFRSGGVLSLAMLVHIVESCPHIHAHFLPSGNVHMLPFGITCINITDMIAKFCMLAKSVDRMDALLSQKPFWRMFGDPNALLALQELSMEILCDVVVELGRERKIPGSSHGQGSLHGEHMGKVTVFDFAEILSRTESRVRDDLLGAGPKTVEELRSIAARLRQTYHREIWLKEEFGRRKNSKGNNNNNNNNNNNSIPKEFSPDHLKQNVAKISGNFKLMTGNMVGTANTLIHKIKETKISTASSSSSTKTTKLTTNSEQRTIEEIDFALPPSMSKKTVEKPNDQNKNKSLRQDLSDPGNTAFAENKAVGVSNNVESESVPSFTIDDEIDVL